MNDSLPNNDSDDPTIEMRSNGSEFKPGTQLGDFVLGEEIGRGGMGVVFQAHELSLNRQVALKVLPPHARGDSALVSRFVVEAKAAAQLNHENIVPVYHIGDQAGTRFFTMKLIEGLDLSKLIRLAKSSVETYREKSTNAKTAFNTTVETRRTAERDFSIDIDLSADAMAASTKQSDKETLRLAKSVALVGHQVAMALSHAHENGIIHRDIKPSNLLMDSASRVWVSDFGLAHLQNASAVTRSGDVLGTLRYMSPEQASGRRGFVDHRTDIFSLGVTLYELATLQHARSGTTAREMLRQATFERPPNVRKINSKLPVDFETIICRATERNPADRYATALEFANDLKKFANNERLSTKRTSRLKYLAAWLYERPLLTAATSAMALLLILTLSLSTFAIYRAKENIAQLVGISESGRMTSEAARTYRDNPGLAIGLSLKAAELAATYEGNAIMMLAMDANYERKTIPIEGRPPGNIVVRPDGKQLLLCSHNKYFSDKSIAATLYDLQTYKPAGKLESQAIITSAAYSSDSRYLLTTGCSFGMLGTSSYADSSFETATLWNAQNATRLQRIPSAKLIRCSQASFSADNQRLVIPAEGNVAAIHEIANWNNRLILKAHQEPVLQAIFSPDQKYVATWSMDGTACIFDAVTAERLVQIEHEARQREQVELEFSPNSRWLLLSGDSGSLVVQTNEPNKNQRFRPERNATFLSNSENLGLLSNDGQRIYAFSPSLNLITSEVACPENIRTLESIPNDSRVIASSRDVAYVVDFNQKRISAEFKGHDDIILDVAGHQDPDFVATVAWDNTIRLWNLQSNQEMRSLPTEVVPYADHLIDYSPMGDQVVIGTVRQSYTSSIELATPAEAFSVRGQLRATLPDGSFLTTDDHAIVRWEPGTLRALARHAIGELVDEVVVLNDPNQVVIQTLSGKLIHWDSMQNISSPLTGLGESAVIAEAANDFTILAGLQSGELVLIDTVTRQREIIASLSSVIADVNFSEDCGRAVVATANNQIEVWDLKAKTKVADFSSDIVPRECFFGLDASTVIVHEGPLGKRAALWELEPVEQKSTHEFSRILDVNMVAGGKTAALATSDGAFLWDLGSDELTEVLDLPCRRVVADDDQIYIATYSGNAAGSDTSDQDALPALFILNRKTLQVVRREELRFDVVEIRAQPEQSRVFFSGESRGAEVVDLDTRLVTAAADGHTSDLVLVGFGPNAKDVVTVSRNGLIQLLANSTGQKINVAAHQAEITSAALAPDRSQLMTSDADGRLALWNLSDNEEPWLRDLLEPPGPALQIQISGDGMAVSRHADGSVLIWDLEDAAAAPQTYQFDSGVRDFSLAPDNRSLMILLGKGNITPVSTKLFDLRDVNPETDDVLLIELESKSKRSISIPYDAVAGHFYAGGRAFAILATDGAVHCFGMNSSKPAIELRDKLPYLSLCGCDPSSETIFAANAVQLVGWNALTGERTHEIRGMTTRIDAIRHLPGWNLYDESAANLVIFGKKKIVFYPTKPGAYVKRLAPRELTQSELQKYQPSLSVEKF